MEIKTKLDVCNEGFFMHNNKLASAFIDEIHIVTKSRANMLGSVFFTTVEYIVECDNKNLWILEENIFPTKQDLLNSL